MLDEKTGKLLEEKVKDPEFLGKVIEKESSKEVVEFLKSENIDITEEEVEAIKSIIVKKVESSENGNELSDEDLEDVAGGFVITTTVTAVGVATAVIGCIGATASIGNMVHKVTRGRW